MSTIEFLERFAEGWNRHDLNGRMTFNLIPSLTEAKMSQFYIGSDPLWAWVCVALGRQNAIKELLNCVWLNTWHAPSDLPYGVFQQRLRR